MKSEKLKKTIFFSLISTISIPLASAQSSIGGGTSLEESLVQFANDLLIYEITSASGFVLYFLAPVAGFYFIQKNMLSFGFELFEERVGRHSFGNRHEDIPNGIKGLSIVTAFITTQMLGAFSAGILLATGLISIVLAIIMQLGLLEGIELGGGGGNTPTNTTTTGDTQNTSPPQNTQTQGGGGGGVNWGQIGQDVAGAVNQYNQYQQNQNNDSLDAALDVFEPGQDIIKLVDKEPMDFRDHVQHIKDGKKKDKSDVNSFEDISTRFDHIESEMEDLKKNKFKPDVNRVSSTRSSLDWGTEAELKNFNYTELINQLQNLKGELNRLKSNQKNQATVFHDHLDESWDDIQAFIKLHQFSQNLPGGPGGVASDNELLSDLVQKASNRNQLGGRSIQQGMNDFKQALNKLDNFDAAHKNIIQNLESELSDEMSLNQTEGDELKRISTEEKKIVKIAQEVREGIDDIDSRFGITNTGSTSPKPGQIKTMLQSVETLGNEVDNHVQDIYSIIDSEGEFENESYEKLKQLI